MGRIIAFVLALILIQSCVTQSRCEKKFPPAVNIKDSVVTRDSVVVKTVIKTVINDSTRIKDSTVINQGASGKDTIPCDENSKTIIRRGQDVFQIEIKNGKIFFSYDLKGTESRYQSVINKREKEYNEAIETFKSSASNVSHSEVKTETKEVMYIPIWVKLLAWTGGLFILWTATKYMISKVVG